MLLIGRGSIADWRRDPFATDASRVASARPMSIVERMAFLDPALPRSRPTITAYRGFAGDAHYWDETAGAWVHCLSGEIWGGP